MAPPRRIPTKAELLRLQRQFKSDARIAERLGNVEPYLVSYWRRKRGVPNYSAPKFSENDIGVLWERFGDDDRCGAALGVSKAAFYSWRRRYGIKSKPAFLKLEQMEIQFPGESYTRSNSNNQGTRPATHKLLLRKRAKQNSSPSATQVATPDLIVVNNPTTSAIAAFIDTDKKPALPADRLAFLLNGHHALNSKEDLDGFAGSGGVHEWTKRRQILQTYCMVDGNMWEGLSESGGVLPGQLVVCQRGFERYSGAIGALGWWCADAEMCDALATGSIEIRLPAVAKVNISGKRYAPICATDIAINLASNLSAMDCSNIALEFGGTALVNMPIPDRQTLCAIGSLIDVRAAVTPCDTLTLRHVSALGNWTFDQVSPDRDAEFADSYQLNIESVKPMVAIKHAGVGSVAQAAQLLLDPSEEREQNREFERKDNASVERGVSFHAAGQLERLEIDVAFLGGSPGGHYESLRKAAEALKGKKVAAGVRLLVSPISQRVYLHCLKRGIIRQLLESGAVILNPGIDSPSLDVFGISATARVATASVEPLFSSAVFAADRFVVSPLTAAVSATAGHLLDPRGN